MRKWFLRIHLYGGLLCCAYLVIFGVSSLNFNHHFLGETGEKRMWQRPVGPPLPDLLNSHAASRGEGTSEPAPSQEKAKADEDKKLLELATRVGDDLGLFGWVIITETRVEANGDLHTKINRPGRRYKIVIKQGIAQVEEERLPLLSVLAPMHGLRKLPGSILVSSWGWYTELTTLFTVFLAASGVYLWTFRRSERRLGLYSLLGAGVAVLGWFVYVIAWA